MSGSNVSTTQENTSATEATINTVGAAASAIAAAVPGVGPVASLAIGGATALADLIVKLTALYSQKIITPEQLLQMVDVSANGFNAAVLAWDNAAPVTKPVA